MNNSVDLNPHGPAFAYREGVFFAASGLWLDPHRPQRLAVVSHAHSDHVRRHECAIATPATAALIKLRYGARPRTLSLPYFQPHCVAALRITLFPAGHVLGAAQVLVEDGSRRLLYSGDICLRASATGDGATVPEADVLIMETTYGRSRYVFPTEDAVARRLAQFCDDALYEGETPVLWAYSLGKAQVAIALLHRLGFAVAAHPSILQINAVYRQHGVVLPDCADLSEGVRGRMAVVCPPQARRGSALTQLGRCRTAVLSGWAMDSGAKFRYQCDDAIPLSDHAGYDDLLRYVELSGAREVYTLHGFTRDFAADLQRRGIAAYPLDRPMQLALPGLQ